MANLIVVILTDYFKKKGDSIVIFNTEKIVPLEGK